MVKKILSVILSVTLLCSMAVVAGASTPEKTEWAENFDSYTADDFYASGDTTSSLWVTADCKEHEAYDSKEGGHYHLNDGWTMQSRGFQSGSYAAYNAWSLKDGDHGKKNSDKSLYADTLRFHHVNLKNNFGGTSVDLTNGNAIGFSFDWYDSSAQTHPAHRNLEREIKMTVTLGNTDTSVAEVKDVELLLGTIIYNRFTSAVGTHSNNAAFETWNDFLIYVSKDTVKARAASTANEISFNIANYTPETGSWSATGNTGYYIKSVKSVEVHLRGINTPIRQNGIDNLKVWISDSIPETLPKKEMPNFLNFAAVQTTVTRQGRGQNFKLVGSEPVNSRIGVQLAGTNSEKIIKPSLVINNNDTVKAPANAGTDSWLKITSDSAGGTGESVFYVIYFDNTGAPVGQVGDIVQTSCNIKIKGDSAAKSTHRLWDIAGSFSTGWGPIVSIAGDGTVFDPDDSSQPLAKLNADTWYSVDAVFSLTDGATNATVYIDGVPVLEKSVTGTWANIVGAVRLCYNSELNGEGTGYLANTVYLDNLCYRIFEGGEGAYDFDKSLTRASNKVMTAATENFTTGVIAPVAADWTVGEFNALGLTNASVVAIADGTETVVSDSAALLKDYTIKIIGDYGKTMYYTVSSDGATLVTKDYLVIAKQNGTVLLDEGACKAGSGISAVAYDKAGTANIIFTAEYDSDNKLVNVVEGKAYAPATAGNTIKLFVWTDKGTIVPVAPETTLRVAE